MKCESKVGTDVTEVTAERQGEVSDPLFLTSTQKHLYVRERAYLSEASKSYVRYLGSWQRCCFESIEAPSGELRPPLDRTGAKSLGRPTSLLDGRRWAGRLPSNHSAGADRVRSPKIVGGQPQSPSCSRRWGAPTDPETDPVASRVSDESYKLSGQGRHQCPGT